MATIPGSPVRRPGTVKASPVKLNFMLSARNLPLKQRGPGLASVQDPLVKVFYKQNYKHESWIDLGMTAYIKNQPNPNWLEVFTFDWIEGSGQVWRFEVFDHDKLSKNDPIGWVEVNVDYYVLSHFQEISMKLTSSTKDEGISAGTLMIKRTVPIAFRIMADDIPHLDPMGGKSDPYVECYWSYGKDGELNLFGTTHVIKNVENADWGRFEFGNFQPGTNQWWTFKVYDKDPLPKDDVIGDCTVEVDSFVKNKTTVIKQLSCDPKNRSTLTIKPASIFYVM
jgi:Ca2+-dependent lipid-binding protein